MTWYADGVSGPGTETGTETGTGAEAGRDTLALPKSQFSADLC